MYPNRAVLVTCIIDFQSDELLFKLPRDCLEHYRWMSTSLKMRRHINVKKSYQEKYAAWSPTNWNLLVPLGIACLIAQRPCSFASSGFCHWKFKNMLAMCLFMTLDKWICIHFHAHSSAVSGPRNPVTTVLVSLLLNMGGVAATWYVPFSTFHKWYPKGRGLRIWMCFSATWHHGLKLKPLQEEQTKCLSNCNVFTSLG